MVPLQSGDASMDFDQLTLTQAAAELRAGKVTSTTLTTEALARAKANADLNAFVTLDEAGALKAAAAFDAAGNAGQAARRRSHRDQGQYRGGRLALQRRNASAHELYPERRRPRGSKAACRRRDHHRQDQHARARLQHFRLQHRVQDRLPNTACAMPMTGA